jgi:hypothetical protein
VSHYPHDVHDVNVAVAVEVTAWIIARIPKLAAPPAAHHHDVGHVHIAVAVQVAK